MDIPNQQPTQTNDISPKPQPSAINPKKRLFLLIGVFVAILVGIVTYAVYVKNSSQEGVACTLEAMQCPDGSYVGRTGPNCRFSPCSASESNASADTSSWKKYRNEKFGYEIMYPAEKFTSCNMDNISPIISFDLVDGPEGTRECFLGEEIGKFGIIHSLEGTGKFEISEYPNCYTVQKEEITVADIKATKYSNLIKNDSGVCAKTAVGYAKNYVHIIFSHNQNNYNIHFYEDEDKDVKYQILSTFKFLE